MRRREFVATGLTGLIAAPAWGAVTPPVIVEVELDGQTYRYDSATGTDLGPYTDPQGQFVQDCIRINHPQLPLSIFIRPDRGTDRLEVVFELGRLWAAEEPQNLGAHKVRIIRAGTAVAAVDMPAHYWFSRWRWQSQPRPIRTAPARLMEQWLVPRLDGRLRFNANPSRDKVVAYEPMGLAGLAPNMGTTGERNEIGLVTEVQAEYLCTENDLALKTMFAQAEAAGSVPWNLRDEKTSAPIDIFAYPRATIYGPQAGNPYIRKTKTPIGPDAAHQPALSYLPFLLTGDPYHLEQLQLTATWNILWRPWDYRYRTTQIRGEAWCLRTWGQVAKVTPANVPKWMLPQAHWKKLLDSYLTWYLQTFVANAEPPRAIFRTTMQAWGGAGGSYQPWQDDFLAAVTGGLVLMGFSEWRPVFEWKIGSTLARTNGRSGWPRAHCTPYILTLRTGPEAPWAQSWNEAWALTAAEFKLTAEDPDTLDLTKLFYFPYTRGALVLAKHIQIRDVDASLDWATRQHDRVISSRKQFPYKWSLA